MRLHTNRNKLMKIGWIITTKTLNKLSTSWLIDLNPLFQELELTSLAKGFLITLPLSLLNKAFKLMSNTYLWSRDSLPRSLISCNKMLWRWILKNKMRFCHKIILKNKKANPKMTQLRILNLKRKWLSLRGKKMI